MKCLNITVLTFAVFQSCVMTVMGLTTTKSPRLCEPSSINLTIAEVPKTSCLIPYKEIHCRGMDGSPWIASLAPRMSFMFVRTLNKSIAFCFETPVGPVGDYSATVELLDEGQNFFEIAMTLTIIGVNDPPYIEDMSTSIPTNAISGQWKVRLNVSDPDTQDKNDTITLSSTDLPRSVFKIQEKMFVFYLVFVGNTRQLIRDRQRQRSGDKEDKLDKDKRRRATYVFHVTAMDASNATSTAEISVNVRYVVNNKPYCRKNGDRRISVPYTTNVSVPILSLFGNDCGDNDDENDDDDNDNDNDNSDDNEITLIELIEQDRCEGAFKIEDRMLMTNRSLEMFDGPCNLEIHVGHTDYDETIRISISLIGCREDVDSRGNRWRTASPGEKVQMACPAQKSGDITRTCSTNSVYLRPKYRCTSRRIAHLLQQVSPGIWTPAVSKKALKIALTSLENETASETEPLQEGDIIASESILKTVADNVDSVSSETMTACLGVVDNLIAANNTHCWEELMTTEGHGAERLFDVIDQFAGKTFANVSNTEEDTLHFSKKNLVMEVGNAVNCRKGINFQVNDRSSSSGRDWFQSSLNQIQFPCSSTGKSTHYSTVYYRNISGIVPLRVGGVNGSSNTSINAAVMSFTLFEGNASASGTLKSPIEITFQMFNASFAEPVCSYWDQSDGNGSGHWASDGCWVARRDSKTVTCACNHLTNFALLMSPGAATLPEIHQTALSVVSVVGCTISIIALVVTIILHGAFWKLVKSDSAILLMHLCVALVIAYLVFLLGINRTESKDFCTAVSVLLHFIYLAVFFLMLAEGVNVAISILFVFVSLKRNYVRWLILQAWGTPLLIVSVSMATTQLFGYGDENFCWLSIESGLIWAFVGPALLVIVANVVIVVAVIRTMLQSASIKTQTDKEKAKTSIRSLCVLMPITGGAWIIGVFSVNSSLVVFQYAFAVLNTLQGLFIFIFHCCRNKKIQDRVSQIRSRRKRGYRQQVTSEGKQGTMSMTHTNDTAVSQC